jgi:DNA-binding HxlR family transcriptional regulator
MTFPLEVLCLKGTAKILFALRRKEGVSFSELAKVVGFSSTATRALKAMEENKLVSRQVLDKPYRPVIYSLTERGRKLAQLLSEIEEI